MEKTVFPLRIIYLFIYYFKFLKNILFIYFRERGGGKEQRGKEREEGKESQADSTLSTEPNAEPDHRTRRSRPDPKPDTQMTEPPWRSKDL